MVGRRQVCKLKENSEGKEGKEGVNGTYIGVGVYRGAERRKE